MPDISLTCRGCGAAFTATTSQHTTATAGDSRPHPTHCHACRGIRRPSHAHRPLPPATDARRDAPSPHPHLGALHETTTRHIAAGSTGSPTRRSAGAEFAPHATWAEAALPGEHALTPAALTADAQPVSAPLGTTAGFHALGLSPASLAAIAALGITEPTPIQEQAIPPLLNGRDVIGQARTGSGKTLAFSLPIVERCDPAVRRVQALVLVPTRELAIQVGDVLARLAASRRLRVTLLYGGRSLQPERQALLAGPQVVVGTPGRTLDHLRQGNLALSRLRLFVLDEGDEMLDRGFAPDVERILGHTPAQRQTALFSATVPEWVMTTAARHLRQPVDVRVDDDTSGPPEITHIVYEVDAAGRLAALRALLDRRGGGPILVFGRTKHGVKRIAQQLVNLGYPVGSLQGNLSQNARERAMTAFRSGELPILLATNVAARGLDVESVERVINYELPESPELFTHRSGRTGRMGRPGEVVTLLTPDEAPKMRQIERVLGHRLPRAAWPYGQLHSAPVGAAPSSDARPARFISPPVRPVPTAPRWATQRLPRTDRV